MADNNNHFGPRAVLELQLQDAERDLAGLIEQRNGLVLHADVLKAQACEPGQSKVACNVAAARCSLRAFGMLGEIADARATVASVRARLAALDAAPVVLSAEQCAAVDDTHNFQAVAA